MVQLVLKQSNEGGAASQDVKNKKATATQVY